MRICLSLVTGTGCGAHNIDEARFCRGCGSGLRVALQLRDVDHLSTDEAAQRLGISTGAMKVRLHRARARLRAILQEIGFER